MKFLLPLLLMFLAPGPPGVAGEETAHQPVVARIELYRVRDDAERVQESVGVFARQ